MATVDLQGRGPCIRQAIWASLVGIRTNRLNRSTPMPFAPPVLGEKSASLSSAILTLKGFNAHVDTCNVPLEVPDSEARRRPMISPEEIYYLTCEEELPIEYEGDPRMLFANRTPSDCVKVYETYSTDSVFGGLCDMPHNKRQLPRYLTPEIVLVNILSDSMNGTVYLTKVLVPASSGIRVPSTHPYYIIDVVCKMTSLTLQGDMVALSATCAKDLLRATRQSDSIMMDSNEVDYILLSNSWMESIAINHLYPDNFYGSFTFWNQKEYAWMNAVFMPVYIRTMDEFLDNVLSSLHDFNLSHNPFFAYDRHQIRCRREIKKKLFMSRKRFLDYYHDDNDSSESDDGDVGELTPDEYRVALDELHDRENQIFASFAQIFLAMIPKARVHGLISHNDCKLDNIMYTRTNDQYLYLRVFTKPRDSATAPRNNTEDPSAKRKKKNDTRWSSPVADKDVTYLRIPTFGRAFILMDMAFAAIYDAPNSCLLISKHPSETLDMDEMYALSPFTDYAQLALSILYHIKLVFSTFRQAARESTFSTYLMGEPSHLEQLDPVPDMQRGICGILHAAELLASLDGERGKVPRFADQDDWIKTFYCVMSKRTRATFYREFFDIFAHNYRIDSSLIPPDARVFSYDLEQVMGCVH